MLHILHISAGKDINEINKRFSLAKAKNNFYGVLAGRKPGIYRTWAECQRQVIGFKGAKFKGFVTLEEAEAFMAAGMVAVLPGMEQVAEQVLPGMAWMAEPVIFSRARLFLWMAPI